MVESSEASTSLFQRMRISTRIYASIAALLTLFLLAVLLACFGLLNLRSNVERHAKARSFANMIDAIDRDVLELQRNASAYSYNGDPAAPARIQLLSTELEEQIDVAKSFTNDDDTLYRLGVMHERLAAFMQRFPEVVAEREKREKGVNEKLRGLEESMKPAFTSLRDFVYNESNDTPAQDVATAERVMSEVSAAQIAALRYFNDPRSSYASETERLIGDAHESLSELLESENSSIRRQAENIRHHLRTYETEFVRSVQATAGYLYLVNVVMAGEASEFLYQSKQIRLQTTAQADQLSADTLSLATNSAFGVVMFAVVGILASALVTTLAVRGIVNPIAAMTSTFKRLMDGDNDAKIPGLNRQDEIGDMARAADLFRHRNQQTEELLAESRRLATELDVKANELERSNADLNSFAYVASHDLRSPLRAIDNIATWLEEDVGETVSEESRSLLHELKRRVRRMEQLLSELLEYSRVGREQIHKTNTNLNDLVAEVVQLVDMPTDATVHTQENMPTIKTDRGSLARVVLNLFSNAIKYRGDDPLRIDCRCELQGGFVRFEVKDNGIGIAPKFHDRIFVMFKRLHSQSQIEGSGMGLALVQKLVEQSGGEIGVESTEGEGAMFWFTWPASNATAQNPRELDESLA